MDNAVIESWHFTVEFELRPVEHFTSKARPRRAVDAWIDDYNTDRRHSSLDMQSWLRTRLRAPPNEAPIRAQQGPRSPQIKSLGIRHRDCVFNAVSHACRANNISQMIDMRWSPETPFAAADVQLVVSYQSQNQGVVNDRPQNTFYRLLQRRRVVFHDSCPRAKYCDAR